MATARPFAYNTGSTISGTTQIGSLAVGTPSSGFTGNPKWWNGPDEDLGYVICRPNTSGNQPNPDNVPAYIRFSRSKLKTDQSFINLVNSVFKQTFTTTSQCTSYLTTNNYWTSYVSLVTSGLILNYDISNSSSYPGVGTTITDLQGNSNATTFNSPTYTSSGGAYLTFDGINEYFTTNTALGSKLNPVNSSTIISIFVWVYPMDNGVIVQEIGQTTPNTNWHDSQIEMVSGTLRFSVWSNNPGFASSISTPLNNWY